MVWTISRWWFQPLFYFHPYLEKIPILTSIFQWGWNHQLDIYFHFNYHALLLKGLVKFRQIDDCSPIMFVKGMTSWYHMNKTHFPRVTTKLWMASSGKPMEKICKNQLTVSLTKVSRGRGVGFFLLLKKWWDEERSNSWDVCFEAGIGNVKSWATLLGGILEDVEGRGREIDKHAFCRRIFECAHGLCVYNADKCSTIRWWSNLIPSESGSRNAEPGRASVRLKSRNVVRNRDFSLFNPNPSVKTSTWWVAQFLANLRAVSANMRSNPVWSRKVNQESGKPEEGVWSRTWTYHHQFEYCLNSLWEATKRNQGWKLGQLTSKSNPQKNPKFWRHLTTTSPKDNHKMVRILVGLRGFSRHFSHGQNSPFGDLDLDRWVKLCLFQFGFEFLFPKKIPTRWAPYHL